MFNKAMHTLSGGTRQKVSAALACMFNPDVLILDEPSAGLDPLAAEHLKDKIKEQKAKGKLVLITSHIMSEVDEIADSVLYLFEGKVKFYKPLTQIKTETGEERLGRALTKILD
jgi:Cu-processing system ATP-binding protein